MGTLTLRLYFILGLLFSMMYLVVVLIGESTGSGSLLSYLIFAGAIVLVQYLVSPKIVEWSMKVKYVTEKDEPELYKMTSEQAQLARLPMPKIGISDMPIPNAFAFGRSQKDGRVCVTRAIRSLLTKDELRAVIGHELAHIKNRDMMVMTILSVLPMLLYMMSRSFMFSGMFGGRNRNNQGGAAIIGLGLLLFYFISNLLVLAVSRIREYKADEGSVLFGNAPDKLASALYKLVYGSARLQENVRASVDGYKAFFLNDPDKAKREISQLSQLDLDKSGTIDKYELQMLNDKEIKITLSDRLMEALTTHPNMLKRIKHLSALRV